MLAPPPPGPARATRRARLASFVPAALGLVFVAASGPSLGILLPNFDEGVYALQAARVLAGDVPYVDFFHHQTPLYLYLLAGWSWLAGSSLAGVRSLSLVATALAGVLVADTARRWHPAAPLWAAVVAQLAFYAAPLQRYGMLALPNAVMVLLCVAAAWTWLFVPRRGGPWGAGALLAGAVFVKPLAIPVVLALVVAAALEARRHLRRMVALCGGGIAAGLALGGAAALGSDGGFLEVLGLQAGRYAARGGFEVMSHLGEFRAAMAARGVRGPLGWNVSEHVAAFTTMGPLNGNAWLLAAAIGGTLRSLRSTGAPRVPHALLLGWLALCGAFALFVWEPIWDHYFVLYLPPLAWLAAGLLAPWTVAPGRRRAIALAAALAYASLGWATRPLDPAGLAALEAAGRRVGGRPLFSFDPLVHVVAGTTPACGLVDPMNVYGAHCAAALDPEGPLRRFHLSEGAILECLGSEVPVLINRYAFWFLDAALGAHLAATAHRLSFASPADQVRFERIWGRGPGR